MHAACTGAALDVKSARERFDSIDVGGQDGKVVYIDGVPQPNALVGRNGTCVV